MLPSSLRGANSRSHTTIALFALACGAFLAACGGDNSTPTTPPVTVTPPTTTPVTPTPATPATLAVIGLGIVNDRFTAEVWVRGTTAYTSSWGARGAVRGNAIKIWDVSSATPTLVDSVIVANAGTTGDVQVSDDGKLLVVAIESNPNGGLAIYALDTPTKPRLLVRTTGGDLQYGVHTAEVEIGRAHV